MANKLGIYLSTNTVNWVLTEVNTNNLIDMGVHVFPRGCENYGAGIHEVSKKFNRRLIRTRRVRLARIRIRKFTLLKALISLKMCPLSTADLYQWKKHKQFPHKQLKDWLSLNPYTLRARGLHEKISLEEFGRILYQIARHHGYRFNERKINASSGKLFFGNPTHRNIGYEQTLQSIKDDTLGEYLNSLLPAEGQSYKHQKEKIRNRICGTDMYVDEIHRLWEVQSTFYHVLNDQHRDLLIGSPDTDKPGGILFFQRPLKSQKNKVGNCIYEPKKTRCCVSALIYQELEAWKWTNTIRINGKRLSSEQAEKVVRFYLQNARFTFDQILQVLKLSENESVNYKANDSLRGSFINAELSKPKYFGSQWFLMTEKQREDIFHNLYFFTSQKRLREYAQNQWGFSRVSAKQFSQININKNYAQISKKASRNILYFLRQGYPYRRAVFLAGMRNGFTTHWETFSMKQRQSICSHALSLYVNVPPSDLAKALKVELTKLLGKDLLDTQRLYAIAQDSSDQPLKQFLPVGNHHDRKIDQLKNALLIQSSYALRKVVNSILAEHGPVKAIACELSVNLKINRMQRFTYKVDQKRIHLNNQRYIEQLKPLGIDLIPINILKYSLWEEAKHTCPFTARAITIDQLYTTAIQIVYIHPWSRSLNDSPLNKTLCYSDIANRLNERTPQEFFTEEYPEEWDNVKKRCARLFSSTKNHPTSYNKFKRFVKKYNHRNLIKKQFNDPHQSSRVIYELLAPVSEHITLVPGNATQHLIDEWLLIHAFPNRSTEEDFRQDILRAYVNAVCSPEHILYLASQSKYRRMTKKIKIPLPNPSYFSDLKEHIEQLLVSCKQKHNSVSSRMIWRDFEQQKKSMKVRAIHGAMHKDTFYGKRSAPMKKAAMHLKKSLTMLQTPAQLEKIVDEPLRKLIKQHVRKEAPVGTKVISRGTFFTTDDKNFPIPKIYLPNKNGDPVPVYGVRVREEFSHPVQLSKEINRYVLPRNNHHVAIYRTSSGDFKEEVVTFWDVVKRYQQQKPIYQDYSSIGGELITHMHINDLYLMGVVNDFDPYMLSKKVIANHLYRIQKLSKNYYEFRLAHKMNSTDDVFPEYIRINNFGARKTGWQTYQPRKVRLSITGKIIAIEN